MSHRSSSQTSPESATEQLPKRQKTDHPPTKGRRKVACKTCSLRKVKCDNIRPECGTCQATSQVCEYPAGPDESWTLDRVADTLVRQMNVISQELHHLRQSINPAGHITFPDRPLMTSYVETPARLTHYNSHEDLVQGSEDYSHIPPHRTTADEVLNWPIFGDKYPSGYFIDWHLGDKLVPKTLHDGIFSTTDDSVLTTTHNVAPVEEARIPALVDNFLKNVHTKNPILDVEELVKKSRQHASQGLTWDGYSCLLLMACALGLVAKPFGSELDALNYNMEIEQARHISAPARERDQADHCFMQGARRLGGLGPSIITAQCYFFAGVYLMYTLRPMNSWKYFFQASITYQLYLKMQGRVGHDNVVSINDPTIMERPSSKRARLEQRLYWSCFKSEAEFRVELPLPQSELASYKFPNAFPSPPSPIVHNEYQAGIPGFSPVSEATTVQGLSITTVLSHESSDEIRMHAKELCNEEESWYYYLTEVALRRIGNCIINTFFQRDPAEWMNIDRYLHVATEFETQVSTWQTHLPPAMQKYETNSTIRAPRVASPGGAEASFVSRELSWATENRLLEMRHWLYQPFLYYLIHARPDPPGFQHGLQADDQLSPTEVNHAQSTFWTLIARAIDCNLTILETRSIPHRHHGLWYDLRAIICSSLLLLGVVKAGYIKLIPDGRNVLVGNVDVVSTEQGRRNLPRRDTGQSVHPTTRIRGRFGRVLRQLEIWSHESPDMLRARELLEAQIRDVFQIR